MKIAHATSVEKIFQAVAEFEGLEDAGFCGVPQKPIFPAKPLKKSAKALQYLRIEQCPLPVITSDTFKGLTNLKTLSLTKSNVTTVEKGAFDDLINLQVLDLTSNNLTTVPDDLFQNNKKLLRADFAYNNIQNIGYESLVTSKLFQASFSLHPLIKKLIMSI